MMQQWLLYWGVAVSGLLGACHSGSNTPAPVVAEAPRPSGLPAVHSYGEAGDALLALRDSERIDVELLREETPLHLVHHLK